MQQTKSKNVVIEWKDISIDVKLDVVYGELHKIRLLKGHGSIKGKNVKGQGDLRIECAIINANLAAGACAARIIISGKPYSFSVFVRDINKDNPVFVPDYKVVLTTAGDSRSYDEIEASIKSKNLLSKKAQIELEAEETYENACKENRDLKCPTWLGVSRDMRFFEVGYSTQMGYWGYIQPRYHSTLQAIPETDNKPYHIGFVVGPGASCRFNINRRLEEGVLPILHSVQKEEGVNYNLTAFCTLEKHLLSEDAVRGSDWRACYPNTGGHMLSAEEINKIKDLIEKEMRQREEETVCAIRVEAVNFTKVPQYAWFMGAYITAGKTIADNKRRGFQILESNRVFAIQTLNGKPLPEEEMAVLLQPGETAVFQMLIPHQPISLERADKLAAAFNFEKHLEACQKYWKAKLNTAAQISVPEREIDERIKAGLLHCDIVALGKEPDEPVLATIGWYSPIGSESSPIIQFFDSMGWHKLAERAIQFFFERQREDGFIQNFGGYQLETGPALWTAGEHYRYTRDEKWVRRMQHKFIKACDFLLTWRARNKKEEFRGKGYGLMDGKVADPQDFFHSFMLNGLSYLGIKRVSEMLRRINPAESARLAKEAEDFRQDIRTAFYESLGRSPLVPLSDGTWVSSFPPWAEYAGPVSLYADGGRWFTHGAFCGRDSLIGSLYLVISEVLDANESGTTALLKSHQQLMTVKNAGFSQPYYCRHDFIHIKRGEVKEFLKTYYNQFTALQDRETYTFWEHYFHASQHKTHEEGWFLMQTRWMLWLEENETLKLLSAIPRRWLENGKNIELKNVVTHFGKLSCSVKSNLACNKIVATIECKGAYRPSCVEIRLPHPECRKAVKVTGGEYIAEQEIVRIKKFKGTHKITLEF